MSSPQPDRAARAETPRRRVRLSLSRTLTLGLALLFLVSLGGTLWISFGAAQRNTFELQRELAELTVDSMIGEVDTQLGAAQAQVEFLSGLIERGDVDPNDEQRLRDLITGALAAAPQVAGIAFVRTDYTVVRVGLDGDTLIALGGSWADREDIRRSMENPEALSQSNWRGISWVDDFDAPHVIFADPVMREDELIGLMFSIVSFEALSGFLEAFDRIGETHSFILHGRDQVLAHASLSKGYAGLSAERFLPPLGEVDDRALRAIWEKSIDPLDDFLGDSAISGHVVRGPDDDYIYFYRELDRYGGKPWMIGVYFLSSEVNQPMRRLIIAGVVGLVILLLAIVVGLLMGRSIVRPMQRLAGASEAIRDLDFRAVQPLNGSLFKELDLAAKAFDSMVAGLKWFETYVPKTLVLRLMASDGGSVRSEERPVTVLFTDIVDFTGIGARLTPADLAGLLNDHFTLLAEAIEAEEGTVDKYIGDSIMAFWGAPFDQADHAARACRAAARVADLIHADNLRRNAAGQAPIRLRIGVHSGPAVVGNIGAPGRVNYTLIGDTVNTAQRLEALGKDVDARAEVMVLLSDATRRDLDETLATEALGGFVLRGHEAEMGVHRLLLQPDAEQEVKTSART